MKLQNLQNWGSCLSGLLRHRRLGLVAGVLTGVAFTVLISCTSMHSFMVTAPQVEGAEFVGNDTCSLCHEQEVKNFQFSVHARLHPADAETDGVTGCESCHGPGSLHSDAGGGRNVHIVNPGKSSDACYKCHADKKADFALPYRHPVPEGEMTCTDCHDPHGSDIMKPGSTLLARTNDTCASCHQDQSKHRTFGHEALRDGCTSCHNVHGSVNKKMLTESNSALCLKCHSEVQATAAGSDIGNRAHVGFLERGTCWSAGCHMAVHGSNVNAHLRY